MDQPDDPVPSRLGALAPVSHGTGRRRLGVGAVIVLVLLAFAVTVGIGLFRGATGAEIVASDGATPAPSSVPPTAGVYVHVAGAVRTAGLYRLEIGDRVADAIAQAGGFADDAERGGVNLARTVTDGEQIVVPVIGAASPAEAGATGATKLAGHAVLFDAATREQLDTLPRIGPALADRILTWRDENGRFTSVDDLGSVPGIGEKMLENLRDLVRV